MKLHDMTKRPEKYSFRLYVSYSQVAIFHAHLENPFNNWTPELVNQGFTWRPGATSFRTLDEDGVLHVTVRVADKHTGIEDAERGIRVPFNVPQSEEVEVASITDGKRISLPLGDYSLFFETWMQNDEMRCALTFCKDFNPKSKIVRCDKKLSPVNPLIMETEPA